VTAAYSGHRRLHSISSSGYFPHHKLHTGPSSSDPWAAAQQQRASSIPLQQQQANSSDAARNAREEAELQLARLDGVVAAVGESAADGAALIAALEQERARAAALAAALWQQLGVLCLWVAGAVPQWKAAAEEAATHAAAQAATHVPPLTAAAAESLASARETATTLATDAEARAAALAAAAATVGTLARVTGLHQVANSLAAPLMARAETSAAAAALAPLIAQTRRAALVAVAFFQRLWAGAPARQAFCQSALIGTLLAHIPLVRGLVGGGGKEKRQAAAAAANEWDWLRGLGSDGGYSWGAGGQKRSGVSSGVPGVADVTAWASARMGGAAAVARGAATELQRSVAEPVTCGSAYLTVSRFGCILNVDMTRSRHFHS